MSKSELKPAAVFEQFAKINQIPRPSKREEKMIAYLKEWGAGHGLETTVDEPGNVITLRWAWLQFKENSVCLTWHSDLVFLSCDLHLQKYEEILKKTKKK